MKRLFTRGDRLSIASSSTSSWHDSPYEYHISEPIDGTTFVHQLGSERVFDNGSSSDSISLEDRSLSNHNTALYPSSSGSSSEETQDRIQSSTLIALAHPRVLSLRGGGNIRQIVTLVTHSTGHFPRIRNKTMRLAMCILGVAPTFKDQYLDQSESEEMLEEFPWFDPTVEEPLDEVLILPIKERLRYY